MESFLGREEEACGHFWSLGVEDLRSTVINLDNGLVLGGDGNATWEIFGYWLNLKHHRIPKQ